MDQKMRIENDMLALYRELLHARKNRADNEEMMNRYETQMLNLKSAWLESWVDSLDGAHRSAFEEKRSRLYLVSELVGNKEKELNLVAEKLDKEAFLARISEITALKTEREQLQYYFMSPVEKLEKEAAIKRLKDKMR